MSAEIINEYRDYTEKAIENFVNSSDEKRFVLVNAVADLKVEKILDLGCGAGQELLPFLEKTEALCVGVDAAWELAAESGKVKNIASGKNASRLAFVRALGEKLPFNDESFDAVLCLVALPYMNNQQAISEIGRVLRKGGKFLLKIHAPRFYFGMLPARLKTLNPKNVAYPLICLAGSFWHQLTGKQLEKGFWQGKEIYQTRGFLEKQFAENNLKISGVLPSSHRQTPLFIIVKS